jgi:hypothetical protein
LRWRILLKKCPFVYLFEDQADEDDEEEVEGFCTTISEAIGKRLHDRKPIVDEEEDDNETKTAVVAEIWKTEDVAIHGESAKATEEALQVLLCVVSWKLLDSLPKSKDSDSDENETMELDDEADVEDMAVLRMRDRLVNLLGLCFDQFLDDTENVIYSDENVDFASSVQESAGRVASDLRTLFPREWSQAVDPIHRALALTGDSQLIGGFARYLKSREKDVSSIRAVLVM